MRGWTRRQTIPSVPNPNIWAAAMGGITWNNESLGLEAFSVEVPNTEREIRVFVCRSLVDLFLPGRFYVEEVNATSILEPFILQYDLRATN